jgi:hypothetical protein
MTQRTPYDTGKRSEPKVWTSGHIEDDDDYGKVDFEDDAGGTLATLYIEQEADRSYTLRGYTNEPLKVEIDDQSGTEEDEAPGPVLGVSTIHWFPGDLVEWRHDDAYGNKVSDYGVVGLTERVLGLTTLWVSVPGHVEPKQWPAAQCRLLRRNGMNKEGQ